MNNVLGGQFTSRLMLNLREDKGYTYGIHSSFLAPRGVGSFICYTQVQTEITREAVAEIVKEMTDIVGPRPLTDTELTNSKNNLIKRLPQQFQTYSGMAGRLSNMVIYDLPDDEWYNIISKVNAVDRAMATQAARDHVHPDALLIVVVGDREKIESGMRELGLGEICFIDTEGNLI